MNGGAGATSAIPAVLVVDDEPDVCWALERILNACGILVVTTTRGAEALRLASGRPFRLAFVNARLPDGDGLDLARRIRGTATGLRTVLISGSFHGEEAEVLAALAAGTIHGFVGKPFLHEEIRTIARDAFTQP